MLQLIATHMDISLQILPEDMETNPDLMNNTKME